MTDGKAEGVTSYRTRTELTYMGRTQSIRDWSRELRVSPAMVCGRMNRGWGVEDALTKPVRSSRPSHPHTCCGQTMSLNAWARQCGISIHMLWREMAAGHTIQEALATCLEGGQPAVRTYRLCGEEHTAWEWSKRVGIGHDTLLRHMANGMTLQEALSQKHRTKMDSRIRCGGVYRLPSEWSAVTGIRKDSIMRRLKGGWSIQDALTIKD